MQIRTYSSLGDAENLADLRVLEAFHIMQHDHRPLPLRQRIQRRCQACPQLISFGRIPKWRSHRLRQLIRIANLSSARNVQRRIRDDPVQPRAKRLIRQKPIEGAVRVQKRILHGILRILMICDYCARHSIRPPFVHPHEFGKRFPPAALSRQDELTLVGRSLSHDPPGRSCCVRRPRFANLPDGAGHAIHSSITLSSTRWLRRPLDAPSPVELGWPRPVSWRSGAAQAEEGSPLSHRADHDSDVGVHFHAQLRRPLDDVLAAHASGKGLVLHLLLDTRYL